METKKENQGNSLWFLDKSKAWARLAERTGGDSNTCCLRPSCGEPSLHTSFLPWTSLFPRPPLWSCHAQIPFVSPASLALLMLFGPKIRLPFAPYPGRAYRNGSIGHQNPLLRSSHLSPLLLVCSLLYHVDSRPHHSTETAKGPTCPCSCQNIRARVSSRLT